MGIEAERQLELHSPAGEDVLLIRELHGTEQLSTCFEYVLSLYSEDHDVDPDMLLGEHVSVRIRCGGQPERYIDGVACEFGFTGSRGRYATYRLVLRPWLWLLSTRSDSRIFQKRTTIEIVREVVSAWEDTDFDLDVRVNDQPPQREYCVQYGESDLSFVMRLLEDDGIYFFFEHELKKHKLVLADGKSAHKPASGFETLKMREWEGSRKDAASIHSWSGNARVRPGGVALRDYDFEKPRADIDVDKKQPKTKQRREQKAIIYEYPGQYLEVDRGQERSQTRLEEAQADFEMTRAVTDASGISAGTLFTLEGHKRKRDNQEYLVTAVEYQADSGAFESGDGASTQFHAKLHCIPSKTRFRPRRRTRWPVMRGAQTATVVGQKEGEVTTDKFARVQVHFPWNRARRPDKAADPPDDHCSCWVRVAQQWTGNGWGSLFIPRVGQEVVVEFLDGNPDRPLITGAVYNGRNKPPYDLPAKASQSGIKTRSLNQGGVDEYNELRFDDDKGHEQIVIHAQRDMSTTINHDCTTSVGHNETHNVANKLAVTVDKDEYTIDVNKKLMKVTVKDTHTTKAKSIYGHVSSELKLDVQNKPVSISMDGSEICLTVMSSAISIKSTGIEIKCGGSSITLDPSGVSVTGPLVKLNC